MELEIEIAPQNSFSQYQISKNNPAEETAQILADGIRLAKDGSRAEARQLLLRVTETTPENETAWLWLASISEYPEELMIFLQRVLHINPHNERALEWAAATRTLLTKTFMQHGSGALLENRPEFARQCFLQAAAHEPRNENIWLELAALAESPEEKTAHLEQVLNLDPANGNALSALESIKNETSQSLLKKANFAAISGEHETAAQLLEEIMKTTPDCEEAWILKAYLAVEPGEKIECYEKVLQLNPENEAAQAGLSALQAIIEKTSEKKSLAESLKEALEANNYAAESATEDFVEVSLVKQPVSDEEYAVPESFSDDEENKLSSFEDVLLPVYFDSPTQELDADFVENGEIVLAFLDEQESESSENCAGNSENSAGHKESFRQPENLNFVSSERDENVAELSNDINFAGQDGNADDEFHVSAADTTFFIDLPSAQKLYPLDEEIFAAETTSEVSAASKEINNTAFGTIPKPDVAFQTELLETAELISAESKFTAPQQECEEVLTYSDVSTEQSAEVLQCPFCHATNETQAIICGSCRTMLSLSDLEMLLAYQDADFEVLQTAIANAEAARAIRKFTVEELTSLAIAHLNAKHLRTGLTCLQEAAQLAPNDIVLSSKINFLAIRLAEIEEQRQKTIETQVRKCTIMIVDDSPTIRKLVSGKLEKCGHTVVSAANGADALTQIKEVTPDLILLDIAMPEMDGYQVCKIIRSNEATCSVPVLMISGKDGFFDEKRGQAAGSTGFIVKPFGPETLLRTIENYLS